ncbi:hypothetical protein DEU56DRAFT_756358 [Suillus clintonianus]|uniref:uncharacterized protein n=1 Tax=Suillus clintonianus TaxID=1904413 RepID=UPI001B868DBE|nr:uncharacterized protein DEU56DRAFT_756358 [Suillus clintonianus]KAG2136455.1 hypothetical protein DEU56DRAFT_756358 [Suillus clintonianus]
MLGRCSITFNHPAVRLRLPLGTASVKNGCQAPAYEAAPIKDHSGQAHTPVKWLPLGTAPIKHTGQAPTSGTAHPHRRLPKEVKITDRRGPPREPSSQGAVPNWGRLTVTNIINMRPSDGSHLLSYLIIYTGCNGDRPSVSQTELPYIRLQCEPAPVGDLIRVEHLSPTTATGEDPIKGSGFWMLTPETRPNKSLRQIPFKSRNKLLIFKRIWFASGSMIKAWKCPESVLTPDL